MNRFLFEEESSTLDFKKEQYLFKNATEIQKAELLKDILAFSNAWRQSDAFILIGVEEVKGGKNKVVGIDADLDDAQFQQFVNSKTQRPIVFSYSNILFCDKNVGLIRIPIQNRPIYLKKNYGNLKANTVYVRRGTSTAEANPDEISEMGSLKSKADQLQPSIIVEFANKNRVRFGTKTEIETTKLQVPPKKNIPDYIEPKQQFPHLNIGYTNRNYYRELIEYYYLKYICRPFIFYFENVSDISALELKIQLLIQKKDFIGLIKGSKFPTEPYYQDLSLSREQLLNISGPSKIKRDTKIIEEISRWIIEIEVPRLQPKSSYFSKDDVYFFSINNTSIELNALIYADNLAIPLQRNLLLNVNVIEKSGDLESIKKIHRESILQKHKIIK